MKLLPKIALIFIILIVVVFTSLVIKNAVTGGADQEPESSRILESVTTVKPIELIA